MNPVQFAKCHCGKQVLRLRIKDTWYTLCDDCYRDSLPNLEGMSKKEMDDTINLIRTYVGEADGLAKAFIDAMQVEQVCRRL